eukprot:gene47225-57837_t
MAIMYLVSSINVQPPALMRDPRSDAELTTVLHSVFLFRYEEANTRLVTDCRHPQVRKNIEAVEDGLRGLIMEATPLSSQVEATYTFVITNHDGRLYVTVRQAHQSFIAVVTALPIMSFSRNFLTLLESEPSDLLLPTIYALCEMPIFPVPDMKYTFEFSDKKSLQITFS